MSVTQQIDMVDNLSFTYDHLDRLVGVTGGYNANYQYDKIGNIKVKDGLYYWYDGEHPHAVTARLAGSTPLDSYAYDANGNMTSRIEVSGTQLITYMQTYDAENRLKIVTNTVSGAVTHFLYDGDGARVAQVTGEGATVYVGEIYEEFHEGVFPAQVQRAAPAAPLATTAVQTLTIGSKDAFLRGESTNLDLYDNEDSMQLLSLNDDFSGSELNMNRWPDVTTPWWPDVTAAMDGSHASRLSVSDGVLRRPYAAGHYNVLSDVLLDTNFGDDFDIEVDYDLMDYAEGAGARVGLATYCKVSESEDEYVNALIQYTLNDFAETPTDTHRIETFIYFTDGSDRSRVDVPDTPYMQGKLRIQRTGTQLRFFYWDGSTYQAVPAMDYEHTAGACNVSLIAGTWPTTADHIPYSVAFDNVHVRENNGGTNWHYLDQGTWRKVVDSCTPLTTWQSMVWHGDVLTDTTVTLRARSCDKAPGTPDNTCGAWQEQALAPGSPMSLSVGSYQYLDVEAVLSTTNPLVTPRVDDLQIVYAPQESAGRVTKYYYLDSRRVAMRTPDGVTYLHGDHLGSTSLTTDESGGVVSKQRYYPYGDVRDATGTTPTDFGFTGQRRDASTGLMYYRARYYDPGLGRFISADTIVPGAASGAGGGVTTLGYDRNTRLTPLTVNLGEFAEQIGAENREVLQFGAFFQWDKETRQEHNVPMGPANPQALNRYTYVLDNPLRYVDPTGHAIALSVILVSGVIGGVFSAGGSFVAQMAQGDGALSERFQNVDWGDVGIAAGVGFAAGAIAPVAATTTAAAAMLGSGANITQYGLTQWSNNESVTAGGILLSGAVGGVTGGISGPFNPQPGGKLLYGSGQQYTIREAASNNGVMQIQYELLATESLIRSGSAALLDNWDWDKQGEVIIK